MNSNMDNRSKSANESASWQVLRPPVDHRPIGEVYDRLIGIPNYVAGMRARNGIPFVPVEATVDSGRGLRSATSATIDALAFHGAYVTDRDGKVLRTGDVAFFVLWPHVAMRHPRYNQNQDTLLDRAKGEACGFVMKGKGTHQARLLMVQNAAAMWLAKP